MRSLAALAALTALLTGCTQEAPAPEPSTSQTPSASAPPTRDGRSNSPSPSPSSSESAVDFTDPEQVAAAFVIAYVRRDYTDADPRAYLENVEPYATPGYFKDLLGSTSDRCDVHCRSGRKNHVRQSADNVGTVIPPEAPRSAKEVWVQVSYEESTTSDSGSGSEAAPTGMVLRMQKSGSRWLVAGEMQGS